MTYLGELIDYRVAMSNGVELRVQTDGQQQILPGTPIKVYLPPEHCHVVAEGV